MSNQIYGIRVEFDGKSAKVGLVDLREDLKSVGNAASSSANEACEAMGRIENSAKQNAFALRQIPMQFTDIVTSLASGQRPLQVLMQQGGQLKDVFGGIGPAASAMGGYIAGLATKTNLAAGAVGALGVAWYQGSKEAENFGRAITLSGNAIGVTVSQMEAMRGRIASSAETTKGAVADVLSQMIESGNVSAGVLEVAANSAVKLEKSGVKATSEFVKELSELGKSPVEASRKLDAQYHYLTASVYAHIKALTEQGKTTEAASVAQETYATEMGGRASSIEKNLGSLERAWKGMGDMAAHAWDMMKGVGREDAAKTLEKARATLEGKSFWQGGLAFGGQENARAIVAVAEARAEIEKKTSSEKAEPARLDTAAKAWLDEEQKYRSREKQLAIDVARIRQEGRAAGASEAEIEARVFSLQRSHVQGMLDVRLSAAQEVANAEVASIEAAVRTQTMSELAGIEAVKAARIKSAQESVAILSRKYQSSDDSVDRARIAQQMQQVSDQASRAIDEAGAKIKALEESHQAALVHFAAMANDSLPPIGAAWLKFWGENQKTFEQAMSNGWTDVIDQFYSAWDSTVNKTMFADSRQQFDALTAEMAQKIEAVRLAAERDGGFLSSFNADIQAKAIREQYLPALNELIAKMDEVKGDSPSNQKAVTDAQRQTQKIAAEMGDSWKSIEHTVHDTFVSIANGGKDTAQRLKESFKNGFYDWLYQMSLKPIMFSVGAQIFGVNGAAAATANAAASSAGTGGIFNLASTANSAFNLSSLPSLTTSIENLSTATSTFSTMVGEGAAITEAASAATAGLGSSVAALAGWGGLALGAVSLLGGGGLFGGGGEDPHNNPDSYVYRYTASRAGLGAGSQYIDKPFYEVMGQTSGAGRWGDATLLDDKAIKALNESVQSLFDSAEKTADQLGLSADSLDTVSIKIDASASDLATAYTKSLSDLSGELAKTLLPTVGDYQTSSETLAATLSRLVTEVESTKTVFDVLGHDFKLNGEAAIQFADGMAKVFGGVSNLTSAFDAYYQGYYTEAERTARTSEQLATKFSELGYVMPATRDEFRALIEGLDLTTGAGQKTFASLMGISSAFGTVADYAKTAADAAVEAAKAQSAAIAEAADASLTEAFSTLGRAVEAQKTALSAAYDDQLSQLETQHAAAQKTSQAAVSAQQTIQSTLSSLSGTLTSAVQSSAELTLSTRLGALGSLQSAYEASQRGESLAPFADGIESAINTLQKPSEALYSSFEEYAADQARANGLLSVLSKGAKDQTSVADLTLRAIQSAADAADQQYEDQKALLAKQHDADIAALDDIVSKAQGQIDALHGIDTSVLSVKDAIANLSSALSQNSSLVKTNDATSAISAAYQSALGRAPDAAGLAYWNAQVASGSSVSSVTNAIANSPEAQIRGAYIDLLGRPADSDGLAYWLNDIAKGQSVADVVASIKASDEYKNSHATGLERVPFDGYKATLHANEAIVDAQSVQAIQRYFGVTPASGDSSALVAEIQQLRAEVQRLQALQSQANDHARRTANAVNGNPEAPILVEVAA